jgi:hypothetical protein
MRTFSRGHKVVTSKAETVTPRARPPRMRTLPIALLLVTATAAAEASTARRIAGAPSSGKLAHAVVEQVDDDHAVLTFVLTTTARGPQEITVPIDLPMGMAATGLSIAMGRDVAMSAVPLRAENARGIYDQVVRQVRDPALLEVTEEGGMLLSVFPVTRGVPARVTIELTAVDKVEGLARVNYTTSLVAAPMAERNDPYADYWPAHREWRPELTVAVNDPE